MHGHPCVSTDIPGPWFPWDSMGIWVPWDPRGYNGIPGISMDIFEKIWISMEPLDIHRNPWMHTDLVSVDIDGFSPARPVSTIKPCMIQYTLLHGEIGTGSLKHLSFIWWSLLT